MIERVARAIREKVPEGYGMTEPESLEYAKVAIAVLRPTNGQVIAAVDEWLYDAEGFSLIAERLPTELEASWLRRAALVGAGVAFPAEDALTSAPETPSPRPHERS